MSFVATIKKDRGCVEDQPQDRSSDLLAPGVIDVAYHVEACCGWSPTQTQSVITVQF